MMRIITGRARGVRLNTLPGEGTRPTSERAKEAVFSMLQFDLQGQAVLDLFAGSGQMALEAISRGASHAVLCDASSAAVGVIRANAEKTRLAPMCRIVCTDWARLLQELSGRSRFGIVFLDPPYAKGYVPAALEQLLRGDLLEPHAKIVCETAEAEDVFQKNEALAAAFEILRATRYGAAFVTVLTPKSQEDLT